MIGAFIEGLLDGIFDFLENNAGKVAIAVGAFFFALVVVLPIGVVVAYYHGANANAIHEACMIEDKESVNSGDSHEYRVYTDCGNFVVQDELWAGNFHASDTYREMKEGHAYDLRTRGWRIPFLSWFPNIYEATPTGETAK